MNKPLAMKACIAVISLVTTIGRAEEPAQDTTDRNITAEERAGERFGIGIVIGEPTGQSAMKWAGDPIAVDAAIARLFEDFNSFRLQVDYLSHDYDLIKTKELPGRLSVYYGIGGRIKLTSRDGIGSKDEDIKLGVRAPVGLSYTLKKNPLELFAELVPLLAVIPETKSGIGVDIGARYYFALR